MTAPETLYCRTCREHRNVSKLKGIGVRFSRKGWWATYWLDCGHTAETPYKEVATG